jgi:ribose 1,5-bisphosphate isomerase
MTNGSNEQTDLAVNLYIEFIHQKMNDFEQRNRQNLELINKYAQSVLSRMNAILLFDYSSTVGKMIETCDHPLEVFIAESRALDGGRPYISQALKGRHTVHFIPDVAIYHYLKKCDGVFIGAETFYADGTVFNTVGTEMVASLCNTFNIPFYILTTLVKIDLRSVYGYNKQPLMLNLRNRISPDLDDQIKDQIDYLCPEVVEISSKWITAFITEAGIVPPSAIFHLSTTFLNENGVITNHA